MTDEAKPWMLCPACLEADVVEGGNRDAGRYHCPSCMRCIDAPMLARAAFNRGKNSASGSYTAGYLAAQRAAVGEREHLEEAARRCYNRMTRNPHWVWSVEDKAWLERERLRRERTGKL